MTDDVKRAPAEQMNRRSFLRTGLLGTFAAVTSATGNAQGQRDVRPTNVDAKFFELDEITIADLRKAIDDGRLTATAIARKYLDRIHDIDRDGPGLRSVIELNPDALEIAGRLDSERGLGKPAGALHGIPVLIKDDIDTADRMATTAGSLALVEAKPPERDAFVVKRLRAAGAVILGKTNLDEWAGMRSSYSSGGWSARGGLTKNPYALDRSPSGSSAGSAVAVAANLCAVAVGAETDGSIVMPASVTGIVGIKPTVGLVSRSGIIPIGHSQDTAGPMARTVRDAALLLNVLAARDAADSSPVPRTGSSVADYTDGLAPDGLKGKRIGVVWNLSRIHEGAEGLLQEAIAAMRDAGAAVVEDADLPAQLDTQAQYFGEELTVLSYEFKHDLNAYLATREEKYPGAAVPRTLGELIRYNEDHRKEEMAWFGQDVFIDSEKRGPLTEREYRRALERNLRLARRDGIDRLMDHYKVKGKRYPLDALVALTEGPPWITDLICGDHFRTRSTAVAAIAAIRASACLSGR
jgi:amidase